MARSRATGPGVPVERRNPLPPGRYWVTLEPLNWEAFNEWKGSSSRIKLEASELHDEDEQRRFEFDVFRVVGGPVAYPFEQFGAPNIAGEDVHSFDDVVQAPDVHEPTAGELVEKIENVGKFALAGAALLAIVSVARLFKKG